MSPSKHRLPQPSGIQWIYDGRELLAVIERRRDGFIVRNRHIGVCADRETALRLVNTTHPQRRIRVNEFTSHCDRNNV